MPRPDGASPDVAASSAFNALNTLPPAQASPTNDVSANRAPPTINAPINTDPASPRSRKRKEKEKEEASQGVVVVEGIIDDGHVITPGVGLALAPDSLDLPLDPPRQDDSANPDLHPSAVKRLSIAVPRPTLSRGWTPSKGDEAGGLAMVLGTPGSEMVNESVMTDTTPGATTTQFSSFNSLGSSQRPILLVQYDSGLSGATSGAPGSLESGMSRPSWKKGGGRVRTYEKSRLAALGFEEELTRDFDFFASWGVAICNIGFLPGTFLGVLTALDYGGGAMYCFAWPISGIFMCALAAILGEMASTYPVAGAMFTWVFRLCRSSKRFDAFARYASWITGSFLLCSHILTQIVLAYQLSTFFQGFIGLHTNSFEPTFWRSIAIAWAILALCGLLVSSAWSRSPWLWRICGGGTMIGFLVMNVVLLAKAPVIRSAQEVFLEYRNSTGFQSRGYVVMIGWALTCVASGVEACSHLAEDTKTPSRTVPMAMFWSVAVSYALGWISICVLLATQQTIGRDPHLVPSIGMLANTLPLPYATLLCIIILLAMCSQNVAQLLATSRFIWALARESALPCSHLLRTISVRRRQPIPAIWVVVSIVAASLLLLRISTSVVGTILLEGAAWSVMFAYLVPVVIYLFCPDDALAGDGRAQWTLRGYSKYLAWPVVLFASVFLVVTCLPTGYPVVSLTASYASAVAFGVLLLSTLAWVFYGNSTLFLVLAGAHLSGPNVALPGRYAGPIKTTTRWTIGAEVELPASTTFKTASLPDETTSAAHGRSAHVYDSFPTLMTNQGGYESHGNYTSGDWSSGAEESQFSHVSGADFRRENARWAGTPEEGVRGRERSTFGRFGGDLSLGGGPPSAATP
ncbi:hypothetical protein P7C70_g1220, partial [Phenoliferia sp. Uapishka_3]